ncbi:60S ribosomal protein l30 [Phtheirospermum japonicum]|uniref:60S ribosomal protein l30 n=1 Tax=Phtheirospermum japonicum TaxID=374723 RepID=A0A830CHT9_9LAMI|nr:60S ribosomal protein l30 [Phtheirospermum japonicum]
MERAGKLILISNNCPLLRNSEIEYNDMIAKVGVHHCNGSEFRLFLLCDALKFLG